MPRKRLGLLATHRPFWPEERAVIKIFLAMFRARRTQLVESRIWSPVVAGSSPAALTIPPWSKGYDGGL